MVNGSLATIWTPYDFYVGETFSHCGVDAANLMSGPDGWRIVALSWTRLQPPECDLHPDGPPSDVKLLYFRASSNDHLCSRLGHG